MRTITTSVAMAFALVACTNIASEDDPRTTAEFVEDGSCSGSPKRCEDRTVSACSGGCTVGNGCASPYLASCAALTSATTCGSNQRCRWSSTYNRCEVSDICYLWDTQSECANDSDGCVWGSTCQGTETSCYDYETSATCKAEGCTWDVGS